MHTKNESSILHRGQKNHVSPKPDIGTDISVYRVASLLKGASLLSDSSTNSYIGDNFHTMSLNFSVAIHSCNLVVLYKNVLCR